MDKITNELFEEVELTEKIQQLISRQISINPMVKKVFLEIARHDPKVNRVLSEESMFGITKESIRTSIHTTTKRSSGSKNADKLVRVVNPSIKVIDDAVSFLDGATLVYYEVEMKEKRWRLNSRGYEMIVYMCKEGIITLDDVVVKLD